MWCSITICKLKVDWWGLQYIPQLIVCYNCPSRIRSYQWIAVSQFGVCEGVAFIYTIKAKHSVVKWERLVHREFPIYITSMTLPLRRSCRLAILTVPGSLVLLTFVSLAVGGIYNPILTFKCALSCCFTPCLNHSWLLEKPILLIPVPNASWDRIQRLCSSRHGKGRPLSSVHM